MKNSLKALFLLLFTLISTSSFAQKVDRFNLSATSPSLVNQLLVLDKEDMSVEDGYKMITEWVNVTYNTPKEVIKGDVENEYIRIQGIKSNGACFKSLGMQVCHDIRYSLTFEFKENKMKFQLTNLELYYKPSETPGFSGWTAYDPTLKLTMKPNGKPRTIQKDQADSVIREINILASYVQGYLENPLAKESTTDDW